MTDIPKLFAQADTLRRFARALRAGFEGFLLDHAARDLAERLALVRRDFTSPLDLGTPMGAFGAALQRPFLAAAEAPDLLPQAPAALLGRVIVDPRALPFAPGAFDLIVSGFLLNRVDDLPGLLMQARAALKPDGLMIACLPGGATLTELRQSLIAAESEIAGSAALRVHPFTDVRDLGGLLQRAGFALPVTDVESLTLRYDTLFALLADLRAMGATGGLTSSGAPPLSRAILMRAAEIYAERFADTDGRIRASVELLWLSGWAAHESQQKPLKRGSAASRLADALGTTETPLPPNPEQNEP